MKKIVDVPKDWSKEWQGMPEFGHKDLSSFSSLIVHFRNKQDRDDFAKLVEQKITHKTKTIWYPEIDTAHASQYRYVDKNSTVVKRREK